MEVCNKDIRKWMIDGRLLLNDTKTEFLAIGTRHQLSKLRSSSIEVGNKKIDRSSTVRSLGVMLDESLGMNSHVNPIRKASFYHIHNIRRTSKYLSKECRQSLVHAYVTSRLGCCSSVLYGLPKYQLSKLQRIQNMAARLITDTMKFVHINPWLLENYRIQFKILMITFEAIHGMVPSYFSNLICIRSSPRYSLRNNDTTFLERPKGVMRTTSGARSFHASAPRCGTACLRTSARLIRCAI